MKNDRRQFERHPVVDDAYAALGRNYTRVGKIIDISIGGLCFDYTSSESNNITPDRVDIFLASNFFNLHNLPCKVAYDIAQQVPKVKSKFVEQLTTRRCGVKFISLSVSNKRKLQAFIDGQPV